MLEEIHAWSPERQQRWGKIRERGSIRYTLRVAAIALLMSVVIAGIYVAANWNDDKTFPMATMVGFPTFMALSGLIVAAIKWRLNESSFRKMQGRRR